MLIALNSRGREKVRRTMAHHAGASPDADAVAKATFIIWNDVEARLSTVIGTKGVDILFKRSLYLTTSSFPWLKGTEHPQDRESLFSGIKACLASRETESSTEAGCAFLNILTELLNTLIGDSLTERLLEPVWVSSPPASEQEKAS